MSILVITFEVCNDQIQDVFFLLHSKRIAVNDVVSGPITAKVNIFNSPSLTCVLCLCAYTLMCVYICIYLFIGICLTYSLYSSSCMCVLESMCFHCSVVVFYYSLNLCINSGLLNTNSQPLVSCRRSGGWWLYCILKMDRVISK